MVPFALAFSPCRMDPGFPELSDTTGALVFPTPKPTLGQPVDADDWKATFEGGPPIAALFVFILEAPETNVIFIVYASPPDRIQYTPDASRLIRSDEGCELEAFDLLLDAG